MVTFAVLSLETFTKLMFLFFPHAVYGAFSCINSKINSKLPKIFSILLFKLIFPSEIDVVLRAVFSSLELLLLLPMRTAYASTHLCTKAFLPEVSSRGFLIVIEGLERPFLLKRLLM